MSFKAYPKYKESGVEWLGRVPEHWEVCRSDAVLGTCRTTIGPESLAGKPVFHYSIPIIQLTGDGQHEDGSEIDSGKLVVTEPQVLVSKLNPRKGTVCIARPQGVLTVCSSEFVPLLPRRADIRFVWYLVQTENYRTRLESLVESATKSHQRAAPSDIYRVTWAFPTKEEQGGIATFLDHETAKIDALIAEQQRLIGLLQEKRQAVVSHAVTKGLNPDAPMKDSGIEWLGEVPEHWVVTRLSHYAMVGNGSTPNRDNPEYWRDGDVPWVSSGEVNQVTVTEASEFVTALAVRECSLAVFPKQTVLVGMVGQGRTRGMSALLAIDSTINQNVAGVVPDHRLDARFLHFVFQAMYEYLREYGRGGNQAALNCEILAATVIPIPPLDEQCSISTRLAAECDRSDSLLRESEVVITLLQERRSALISAAVTGQIDVRDFAGGSEAA